ncbi:MAG: ABC transporter ATP-binding protein [Actinobacteria bacterium]|nr:ABC transporter ATP-binding protein [Actinomycetota bacterium]
MTYNVNTAATQTASAPDRRPAPDQVAVEVRELVKTYRGADGAGFNAVDGASFEVRRGELFGFLGPNGAGKTTTLEIVEGIREPSSGHASVLGLDSVAEREELKRRIGVQLQAGAYFNFLTLEEILELFGSFYPRRRAPHELLARVGLLDKRGAQVRHLSGGQARRFSVVAALVNDPEVVFLDEPTTGLDPAARRTVWELIGEINREEGKTVVLTTHYMEEAELLAERIAIIDQGQIQALDTPARLIARYGRAGGVRFAAERPIDISVLEALPGVERAMETGSPEAGGGYGYELRAADPDAALFELISWRDGLGLRSLEVLRGTLEDVFLELTGRELRD